MYPSNSSNTSAMPSYMYSPNAGMSKFQFSHSVLAMHGEKLLYSWLLVLKPIGRFQGQATDVDIARKEIRNVKIEMVKLLSRHIGKPMEEIARDIRRPKYFSPSEAVDYGIIDKVLHNVKSQTDAGLVSEVKKELI
ncbi:unnamed protein product [Triticum turgidum subsp. durum]|uniref:ATP-dependent Clp protease proteolytic subunit n=1 Tax=Triticum turgidum subsp. durum TaxID=4567 RepID=A0A9R1QET6_TRITD|nr:unnamed protein product [Triticum turgidum subsp. durum]